MKHVILGAGPAGVIAAETIRKHAPADEIVVIGDEPEAPYSRMAIPYLLIGKVGEEGTHLRHGANHFTTLGITVKRGRAKGVDIKTRVVALEDGKQRALRQAADRHRFIPGHAAHPRHPWQGRAPLLDAAGRPRHHGAGETRRARAATGCRVHRLHHHGSAGHARREAHRR